MKVNPFGKVPLLMDGDYKLPESIAIIKYICDVKAPGNAIYPADAK